MKRLIYRNWQENEELEGILCMTSVRGFKMRNPSKLPFSFYFSGRNSSHGPRVKVSFDPNRLMSNKVGTLELNSDWEFTPGQDDKKVSNKQISFMKEFFRKYLVLFLLVWEFELSDPDLGDYFEGSIDFKDLIQNIDFYNEYKDDLDKIEDVESLEKFCRKNNLVDMYSN